MEIDPIWHTYLDAMFISEPSYRVADICAKPVDIAYYRLRGIVEFDRVIRNEPDRLTSSEESLTRLEKTILTKFGSRARVI